MAQAINNLKAKLMDSVEIPVLTKCCFCIPLRKGLICMAYLNLVITCLILPFFTYFIFTYTPKEHAKMFGREESQLMPQLVIELVALLAEMIMNIVFLVGLHMKRVPLMKAYLYFGIVFTIFSFLYNVVITVISTETANEFVLVITQLMIHFYFLVLVWSSIVKMTRDGPVKYTRSVDPA